MNHSFQKRKTDQFLVQVVQSSPARLSSLLGIAGVKRVDPCGGRVYLQKNSRRTVVLGLGFWGRTLRFYAAISYGTRAEDFFSSDLQ